VIELKGIEKRFGDNVVLKDISVTMAERSVTALVGPSGGGKSTLLRCINLLELPNAGTVRIGDDALTFGQGHRVATRDIQRLRRQTGMVFQNFQLFPHRTAIENVMEGLTVVLKWPEAKARERAMALLEKVGMAHKADAWPATLSGGQQQRVAIARALAPSPTVLLCDEPTSALDPELAQGWSTCSTGWPRRAPPWSWRRMTCGSPPKSPTRWCSSTPAPLSRRGRRRRCSANRSANAPSASSPR
jgi:cystine transport system ATP-binding protein